MTFAHPVLRWDEEFGQVNRITITRHKLFGNQEAHDHDFMELVVVLAGHSMHDSPQGTCALSPGDALLLRPGTWHVYRECAGLEVINFCFPFSFAGAEWRDHVDERVRYLLRSGDGLQTTRFSPGVIHALDEMESLNRSATGALGLFIWSLDQFADAVPIAVHKFHPAVEKAVAAMEKSPNVEWTAPALAREVGLDKAYLSRLFKAQVGVAPMTYLAMLRAERAAFLLRHSEMNCSQVGEAAGYTSPELFSRRFRARYGVSPSAYRKLPTTGQANTELVKP